MGALCLVDYTVGGRMRYDIFCEASHDANSVKRVAVAAGGGGLVQVSARACVHSGQRSRGRADRQWAVTWGLGGVNLSCNRCFPTVVHSVLGQADGCRCWAALLCEPEAGPSTMLNVWHSVQPWRPRDAQETEFAHHRSVLGSGIGGRIRGRDRHRLVSAAGSWAHASDPAMHQI